MPNIVKSEGSSMLSLSEVKEYAGYFIESGLFTDAKDLSQGIVKIIAGQEMGLEPLRAMGGINIIKGKISMSAGLMASIIDEHPQYDFKVLTNTDRLCEIEFFKNGVSKGISKFDLTDAQRAGTQNMAKFPRNMLYARAMSNGCKWLVPGAFGRPVYTAEELGGREDEQELKDAEVVMSQNSEKSLIELQTEAKGYLDKKLFSEKEIIKFTEAIDSLSREQLKENISELRKKRDDRQKKYDEKYGKKKQDHHAAFIEDAQVDNEESVTEDAEEVEL